MEQLVRARELLAEAAESSRLTIGMEHLRTLQRLAHLWCADNAVVPGPCSETGRAQSGDSVLYYISGLHVLDH